MNLLHNLLQSILKSKPNNTAHPSPDIEDYPAERLQALKKLHEQAPVDFHIKLLFDQIKINEHNFLDLFNSCLIESGTGLSAWKHFIRAQSALNLVRYFLHSMDIKGARVECGVFMGFSALLMSRAAKIKNPSFNGKDLYLIDSFSGFSKPIEKDFISFRSKSINQTNKAPAFGLGDGIASFAHIQQLLSKFPDATIIKDWIPGAFSLLPSTTWAFVHIDVDLYEPTRDCLKYFHPRMTDGGVLICDDYGSTLFPGAKKAWDEYFQEHDLPFVILETGQSIYVNQGINYQ